MSPQKQNAHVTARDVLPSIAGHKQELWLPGTVATQSMITTTTTTTTTTRDGGSSVGGSAHRVGGERAALLRTSLGGYDLCEARCRQINELLTLPQCLSLASTLFDMGAHEGAAVECDVLEAMRCARVHSPPATSGRVVHDDDDDDDVAGAADGSRHFYQQCSVALQYLTALFCTRSYDVYADAIVALDLLSSPHRAPSQYASQMMIVWLCGAILRKWCVHVDVTPHAAERGDNVDCDAAEKWRLRTEAHKQNAPYCDDDGHTPTDAVGRGRDIGGLDAPFRFSISAVATWQSAVGSDTLCDVSLSRLRSMSINIDQTCTNHRRTTVFSN